MLCKKCNTAISETEQICNYCGTDMSKIRKKQNHALIMTCGAIGISILLYFISPISENTNAEDVIEQDELDKPTHIQNEAPALQVKAMTQKVAEEIPTEAPNFERTLDDVLELVQSAAISVQEYYDKYNDEVLFITKNGYLFEIPANTYIKMDHLWGITSADPNILNEPILILYLKPSDLAQFEQLEIEMSKGLRILAAYETREGFAIASSDNIVGILPREDLSRLMEKYVVSNGEIIRPTLGSDTYENIFRTIRNYKGLSKELNVRYIAANDEFAVVIISEKGISSALEFYVLRKSNSDFEVVTKDLQNEKSIPISINQKFPNFDYALLPQFNLNDMNNVRDSFPELLNILRDREIITQTDGQPIFTSASNGFAYFEFESGRKLLGYLNQNNEWEINLVSNYYEAEILMQKFDAMAPSYILRI